MNARRNGFTSRGAIATIGAAALVLAALVAVIGSAQAAPSTKIYDATVHVAERTPRRPDADKRNADARRSRTTRGASRRSARRTSPRPPGSRSRGRLSRRTSRNGVDCRDQQGRSRRRSASTSNALKPGEACVSADVRRHVPRRVRRRDVDDVSRSSRTTSAAPGTTSHPGTLSNFAARQLRHRRRSRRVTIGDQTFQRSHRTADRLSSHERRSRRHRLRHLRCCVRRLRTGSAHARHSTRRRHVPPQAATSTIPRSTGSTWRRCRLGDHRRQSSSRRATGSSSTDAGHGRQRRRATSSTSSRRSAPADDETCHWDDDGNKIHVER